MPVRRSTFDEVVRQRDEAMDEAGRYRGLIERSQSIGSGIVRAVEQRLEEGEFEEDVWRVAAFDAEQAHVESVVGKLAKALRTEQTQKSTASLIGEFPGLLEEIRENYINNGTFDALAAEEQLKMRESARAIVFGELHQRAKDEAAQDKDNFKDEERDRYEASYEFADYKNEVRASNEEQWRSEVEADCKQRIDKEEQEREEAFKKQAAKEFMESEEAARYRQERRAKLEEEWAELSQVAVLETIDADTLMQIRAKEQAQALRQRERELDITELRDEFTSGNGISVDRFKNGDELVLYLGSKSTPIEEYTVRTRHGYPEKKQRRISILHQVRSLRLTRVAEGFVVDSDSLAEVDSHFVPYIEDNVVPEGTVVDVGRVMTDESGDTQLSPAIKQGIEPFYRSHANGNSPTGMGCKLVGLSVNGHDIVQFDRIEVSR
ncbi:TPA: hypothetical protein EYO12_02170 [Candidatus Saccharibacteria bacterium]|nr:hypothetical protein [Candidatus Saccharibacteria bacterium]HIO87522.1 hypothetical protein [Candidatus Saccharibacteria bacterium]